MNLNDNGNLVTQKRPSQSAEKKKAKVVHHRAFWEFLSCWCYQKYVSSNATNGTAKLQTSNFPYFKCAALRMKEVSLNLYYPS